MTGERTSTVLVPAVTAELGGYRAEVTRLLPRRDIEVRDQEHVR